MSEPKSIEPQPARSFLLGLGFLGGMLTFTFVQCAAKANLEGAIGSLVGVIAVIAIHRRLEREIPRSVDTISSQVAQLPEDSRAGLRDYLKSMLRNRSDSE